MPLPTHAAVTSVIDLTCDLPRWDLTCKAAGLKLGLLDVQNYLSLPNWDGELDAQVHSICAD